MSREVGDIRAARAATTSVAGELRATPAPDRHGESDLQVLTIRQVLDSSMFSEMAVSRSSVDVVARTESWVRVALEEHCRHFDLEPVEGVAIEWSCYGRVLVRPVDES